MLKDRKVFEKIEKDRKRNCLVLVLKFLLDNGYVEALTKLEQESTCSLSQWALADNMSLTVVVAEFETYHEIKFGSIPMISKKLGPDEYGPPDLKKGGTKLQGSGSKLPPMKPSPTPAVTKATAPPTKQTAGTPTTAAGSSKGSNGNFQLEIEGEGVDLSKKPKDKDPMAENEDYFQERVLKGIPEFYMHNAELRELAMSLQRDIIIQNPKVRFKEIVGLEDAKRVLREAVRLPTLFPQYFTGALEPWRGALLFGPPGTGKTLLAKAVASECRTIFFNISASSLVSKWQGESEKMVRVLFDLARHHQPSTIFLDEIDSIMSQRAGSNQHEGSRRLKTELLIQMDGLARGTERVFVLAASNLPWDLDNALLRRLEKRIYVPLPSKESREAMLRQFIPNNSIPGIKNELDYSALSARMDGFSGSDIKSLCKEALMKPLRRLFKSLELPDGTFKEAPAALKPELVSAADFEEALQCTRPSPSTADGVYKEYFAKFGAN